MKLKISEKQIEKAIITWLYAQRIFCTKVDNVGIYDAKLKSYRRQHGTFRLKGISDIFFATHDHWGWIEVKSKTGRVSPDQQRFLDQVKELGGVAIVARSVEDVETRLSQLVSTSQMTRDIQNTFDSLREENKILRSYLHEEILCEIDEKVRGLN